MVLDCDSIFNFPVFAGFRGSYPNDFWTPILEITIFHISKSFFSIKTKNRCQKSKT